MHVATSVQPESARLVCNAELSTKLCDIDDLEAHVSPLNKAVLFARPIRAALC